MTLNNKEIPEISQLDDAVKSIRGRHEYFKLLRSTVGSLAVVAAIAVLISMLFLPVLRVTGTSMSPTLANGDLVICRKRGDFKRGDVVAFYYNNKILLKRVIGVAGEQISVDKNGNVTVNGKVLDEPYLSVKSLGECDIDFPYQVPETRIFVMGDNRETSIDSRTKRIGCVAEEAIVGKVIFRINTFEIM